MKAKNPASATPIVSNVVATGRPMNGADGFTLRHSSRSSPVANAKADRAAETSAQFSEFGGHPPPTSDEDYSGILATMKARGRRPIDYFRLFYNDTAVGGARSAIRCGLDFFGTDRELFATDCPFDPEGGPMFIRETIAALDGLTLAEAERAAIYFRNALRMLKM